MLQTTYKHIAIFSLEAWGHTRPTCTFVSRLIRLELAYVTFFVTTILYDRVQAEISRCFRPEDANIRDLIRVVALYVGESREMGERFRQGETASIAAFEDLTNELPVICAHTRQKTEPIPGPDIVIADMFMQGVVEAVPKHSKKPTKIYTWYTSSASNALWLFGPPRLGGRGDLRAKVREEAERSGTSINAIADELMAGWNDSLRQIPGLPLMYDYERYPQQFTPSGLIGGFFMSAMNCIAKSDGLICTTVEALEPESFVALRDWLGELGKSIHVVGLLIPDTRNGSAVAGETKQSADGGPIEAFLDSTLNIHGKKSLLYVSFGTVHWLTYPEKIWAFLDVVMKKNIPFILCHASPSALIPEEFATKVQKYGSGILSKWAPQQTILSHPATGWFVSHCGQNSILEAVNEGIPLICWPLQGDQAINAAHITTNLGIGYEVFEVRSGTGLRPIHRLGGRTPTATVEAVREEASMILDKAFGEDGKVKRTDAEKLRRRVLGAWAEDGPAIRELQVIADMLVV